jgi:hypothetical protein
MKGNPMFRTLLTLSIALVTFASGHAAIVNLPGLNTVRFWETSGPTSQYNFPSNGLAMNAQLGVGILGPSNNDFSGVPSENYDVFYSDANGAFNPNGNYVTVEAVYPNSSGGGGLNLAAVDLVGTFGIKRADILTSWVGLGPNYIPLSENLAVDTDTPNPTTFTTMGSTVIPPQAHLRVTVGWSSIPEPASAFLLASGAAALLLPRRRRRAAKQA